MQSYFAIFEQFQQFTLLGDSKTSPPILLWNYQNLVESHTQWVMVTVNNCWHKQYSSWKYNSFWKDGICCIETLYLNQNFQRRQFMNWFYFSRQFVWIQLDKMFSFWVLIIDNSHLMDERGKNWWNIQDSTKLVPS